MSRLRVLFAAAVIGWTASASAQDRLQSSDLLKLRSVSAVQLSPDATRVAYAIENNDGSGRPYTQLWVLTLADGKAVCLRRRQGAVRRSAMVARRPVDRVSRSCGRKDGPRRRASRGARARHDLSPMTGTRTPVRYLSRPYNKAGDDVVVLPLRLFRRVLSNRAHLPRSAPPARSASRRRSASGSSSCANASSGVAARACPHRSGSSASASFSGVQSHWMSSGMTFSPSTRLVSTIEGALMRYFRISSIFETR